VIDDGSTDGTTEMVKQEIPSATILNGNGDLWWAGSLQKGLEYLSHNGIQDTDYVLFLNDDQDFDSRLFERALNILAENPSSFFLPQCIDMQTGASIVGGAGVCFNVKSLEYRDAKPDEEFNCLATRALFCRFGDIKRTGGFRPRLLPHYFSDYEFAIRAHRNGIRLIAGKDIFVKVNQSTTGPRVLRNVTSLKEKVKIAFSNRYPGNPIHFTRFTWMVSPWPYALKNTVRIWTSPLRTRVLRKLNRSKDSSDLPVL
jgi:GT2 family glycosyltransferase